MKHYCLFPIPCSLSPLANFIEGARYESTHPSHTSHTPHPPHTSKTPHTQLTKILIHPIENRYKPSHIGTSCPYQSIFFYLLTLLSTY